MSGRFCLFSPFNKTPDNSKITAEGGESEIKMSYKLAIFDLDGTILDTLEDLADSVNFALSVHSYPLRTIAEIQSFIGNGVSKLIERSVPAGTDKSVEKEVLADFRAHYKTNFTNKTKPYNGISEMLQHIRSEGCRTAVLSNKSDPFVKELCKLYFDGCFDCTAGEKEGIPRKPAPDGVVEILKNLGFSAKECVYIGDTEVDISTAKNAGMDCISVDWGFRTREELVSFGGERIVSDTEELATLILGR